MPLAPGSSLGRFRVLRQLGAGAMGEVYLAEDPQIERRLAIKTVRLDVQETASEPLRTQLRLRIEREARAAGRLLHPHVVTLFDVGEVDGLFYLAFEYIDGPNLALRSRQQPPLTLADVLRIGRQAASALEAAHRVGIVHRDIKPSNLLLTSDGTVKVADFGIAALAGQGTQLTQAGVLIGTPQYLSPEQVQSDSPLDGRSDLFSLGVVIYELLAGKRPFEGGTLPALLYAIVAGEPQPLGGLRPDLPPRLTAAVMRLLAKERNQRFPTAAALGEELAAIEHELDARTQDPAQLPTLHLTPPVVVPPTLLQPTAVVPVRRKRGWLAVTVIVASLLLLSTVVAGGLYFGVLPRLRQGGAPQKAGESRPATPAQSTATQQAPAQPLETAVANQPLQSGSEVAPANSDVHASIPVVGGMVSFRVTPQEASERAVVKVDGLVRGVAGGSLMTLRPGRHEIEISAEGYDSAKVVVEARDDPNAASEYAVSLTKH